jgi:hypothetical protein
VRSQLNARSLGRSITVRQGGTISRLRIVVVALLSACAPLTPLSCGSPPDVSQFGAYEGPFKSVRLPSGDSLTVYRVKYWTFTDGSAPALQLEYQTQVSIADTVAVQSEQRRIWPVFKTYIDRAAVSNAILTATDRHYSGGPAAHLTFMKHFGSIAVRDTHGAWRFDGDSTPLSPAVPAHGADGKRIGIFERSGAPFSIGRLP